MGIPGLTKYISNHSDRYLHYYELHDCYLVIDGNSVACQIYNLYAKCNCAFGGDYDKYAKTVAQFFGDLLKCKVKPLVLFDGGCENKKLKTVISRTKQRVRIASKYSPQEQQRKKFFPLLMKEVFKCVMTNKNIRYVTCLFEADNTIAAVARILNCPVLSYDSDFYIYGSSYIPFDTLDSRIIQTSDGNGYMKPCSIYRVENLVRSFKGLHESLLPLAAILLGNDYVPRGAFRGFYRQLKLPDAKRKKHNFQQCRIGATFTWLSRYTLDKAVISILSRLPKHVRKKVLDVIETNINGYTNASAEILVPLGFTKDYAANVNTHSINRIFKFDGDIDNLTYIEETCKAEDSESSEGQDEDEVEGTEIIDEICDAKLDDNDSVVEKLPLWFVDDFKMSHYPSYFMDLILRSLYVCPVQIESYVHASSIKISLRIISVIYGLLISGIDGKPKSMKYMTRGEQMRLNCQVLECENVLSFELPSLESLREVPVELRRQILNEALQITDYQCINQLLPDWLLYIAVIKYWLEQQQEEYFRSPNFVYSILFCMLFDTIDRKIGRHRSEHNFQKSCQKKIYHIQQERKILNVRPCYSTNVTITQALNEVETSDCLLAASFFISHFEFGRNFFSNPKKFNRTAVHAFAEFQSCLMHTMNLNALLGYPYKQPNVAQLFNGTFLHNIYNNFKSRNNIAAYLKVALQDSPSLLRLFEIIVSTVKPLFGTLLGINIHDCKTVNRKKRKKTKMQHTQSCL